MSLAGVFSNRGDDFQNGIAFTFAVDMLIGEDIEWIELDATSTDASGEPFLVDDVVASIRGTILCCQSKKNETQFATWTLSSLEDELQKAKIQLSRDSRVVVRFYSHSPFGLLQKLVERAASISDELAFDNTMTAELKPVRDGLAALSSPIAISVYQMLRRLEFVTVPNMETEIERATGRLVKVATNAAAAKAVLWSWIDRTSARKNVPGITRAGGRISKVEAITQLQAAGSVLAGQIDERIAVHRLARMSAVGTNWRRDAGGIRIERKEVSEIHKAILDGVKSIVVGGVPGSGKSCVLLDLRDRLLADSARIAVYVQCREFADWSTTEERRRAGFEDSLVDFVARLAETRACTVLFDSLDVLSLSRSHEALSFFLALIDQLYSIPRVSVVAACRTFDLRYDSRLSHRSWERTFTLGDFDWKSDCVPVFDRLGMDVASISARTRSLASNPRMLTIFIDIAMRGGRSDLTTAEALTEEYLRLVVLGDARLGKPAMNALEEFAAKMLRRRRLTLAEGEFVAESQKIETLLSLNVLIGNQRGALGFGHQTLLDALSVRRARRLGEGIMQFAKSLPQVPFVRPTLRWFVRDLRSADRADFRSNFIAFLAADMPFHFKRLVVETFAEMEPEDLDLGVVLFLYKSHRPLFEVILTMADVSLWGEFLIKRIIPSIANNRDIPMYLAVLGRMKHWKTATEPSPVTFFLSTLDEGWLPIDDLRRRLPWLLSDGELQGHPKYGELLERLVDGRAEEHSGLGHALSRWVEATGKGDDLLWRYVVARLKGDRKTEHELDQSLQCAPHDFHSAEFLQRRMNESDELLNLALASIKTWLSQWYDSGRNYYYKDFLLNYTTYQVVHSDDANDHVGPLRALMDAVEFAITLRARNDSTWWQANASSLLQPAAVLRYILLRSCVAATKCSSDLAKQLLLGSDVLTSRLRFEAAAFLSHASWSLSNDDQDRLTDLLLHLYERDEALNRDAADRVRAQFFRAIPAPLRSSAVAEELNRIEERLGPIVLEPEIFSGGGWVTSPISAAQLTGFSDSGLRRVLRYFANAAEDGQWIPGSGHMIGGRREVGIQLGISARRDPVRFLQLVDSGEIPENFIWDVLSGIGDHISYAQGHYSGGEEGAQYLPEEALSALADNLLRSANVQQSRLKDDRSTARVVIAAAFGTRTVAKLPPLLRLAEMLRQSNDPDDNAVRADDLVTQGINSVRGQAAEAVVVAFTNTVEDTVDIPGALVASLFLFARDTHPAVRATMLRRLPTVIRIDPRLGWMLFAVLVKDGSIETWKIAEPCLYYNYARSPEVVRLLLEQMLDAGHVEGFARIATLMALGNDAKFEPLIRRFRESGQAAAWSSAASVFVANSQAPEIREYCQRGFVAALSESPEPGKVASQFQAVANRTEKPESWSPEILTRVLQALAVQEGPRGKLHGVDDWLAQLAEIDPMAALQLAEAWVPGIGHGAENLYTGDEVSKLLTRLFRMAEEWEQTDTGQRLQRVIALQDLLLEKSGWCLTDWLAAAERP